MNVSNNVKTSIFGAKNKKQSTKSTQARNVNLNLSQTNPLINTSFIDMEAEILKEKHKIQRFINIREQQGRLRSERQYKFEQRLKDGDKKCHELAKKRRQEQKAKAEQIEEKTIEANDKRNKVKQDIAAKDNKAFDEYKR